jgi:hypothetical protein
MYFVKLSAIVRPSVAALRAVSVSWSGSPRRDPFVVEHTTTTRCGDRGAAIRLWTA